MKIIGFFSKVLILVFVFIFVSIDVTYAITEKQKLLFDAGIGYSDPAGRELSCGLNSSPGSGLGQSLYFIGDSLTVGMRDFGELGKKLKSSNWSVSDIEATEGDTVAKALPKLQNDGALVSGSNTIVIALGTNTESDFGSQVSAIVSKVKEYSNDATIYWVNAYAESADYTTINDTLSAQSNALGFTILDWATEAATNPELYPFAGDGIHHTVDGYKSKSDFVVNSLGDALPNGSQAVTSGAVQTVEGDNAQKIWSFLLSTGLTAEQTAGIMGNLQAESGFNPDINEKNPLVAGSRGGFGIAQWTAGRRVALEAEADAQGVSVSDLGFQLQYLYNESNARRSKTYPDIKEWEGLLKQTTIENSTTYWEDNFERPKVSNYSVRIKNAAEIFERFKDFLPQNYLFGCGASTDGAAQGQDTSSLSCPSGTTDAGIEQDYGRGRVPTVKVRLCNVLGVTKVNASISAAALNMLQAAESAGLTLKGSSWRSYDNQVYLRGVNGCPDSDISPASSCAVPTARPGSGNHEVGLAIDFKNMCFPNATCPSSHTAWVWLTENAATFGFKKLSSEAWHWSINGR